MIFYQVVVYDKFFAGDRSYYSIICMTLPGLQCCKSGLIEIIMAHTVIRKMHLIAVVYTDRT